MKELTVKEWLNTPCLPEEISGDAESGWFLGIEILRKKLKYLEDKFGVLVGYSDFNHLIFNAPDRRSFASGSLNMELKFEDGTTKRLVGGATFDLQEYAPNTHFAATLKSLCIGNGLLEYEAFGRSLNKDPLPAKEIPKYETKERKSFREKLAECKTVNEVFQYNKEAKGMRDLYNSRINELKLQNDTIK